MIINAERMRLEEDSDNNMWLVDFRDEAKSLRGRIEVPLGLIPMEEFKEFTIEIIPQDKKKSSQEYSDAHLVYNAISFRTRPVGDENVYSFSAGGLILRIYTTSEIKEIQPVLKDFKIILK
ncbi:hypothetical protein [Candidatus Hodarchaeum mangrovi]